MLRGKPGVSYASNAILKHLGPVEAKFFNPLRVLSLKCNLYVVQWCILFFESLRNLLGSIFDSSRSRTNANYCKVDKLLRTPTNVYLISGFLVPYALYMTWEREEIFGNVTETE